MALYTINEKLAPSFENESTHELDLAPNLLVDIDHVIGKGIFLSGITGSGKTVVAKRIAEQFGKYNIPLVIFDTQGDWHYITKSLPRGFVATYKNCPSGGDVLLHGLQVVYDFTTWPDMDEAPAVMAKVIKQLFTYALTQEKQERVPCYVFLDEAQKWVPQDRPKTYDEDAYKLVLEAFKDLGERGRKFGLTPALFCHRISAIEKNVIAQCQWFILMQQTGHRDLVAYMDYISTGDLTQAQMKNRIKVFTPGKAIIRFPQPLNKQVITTFHPCESYHPSHAPKVLAAMNKYGDQPFDPDALCFGDPEEPVELVSDDPADSLVKEARRTAVKEVMKQQSSPTPPTPPTPKTSAKSVPLRTRPSKQLREVMQSDGFYTLTAPARVHLLLAVDPSLRVKELTTFCRCDVGSASRARSAYFKQHS